jgi:hypothetical protein
MSRRRVVYRVCRGRPSNVGSQSRDDGFKKQVDDNIGYVLKMMQLAAPYLLTRAPQSAVKRDPQSSMQRPAPTKVFLAAANRSKVIR